MKLAALLARLDAAVAARAAEERTRTKVAVIMGGYSSERHISVESGRNIYEKLSSSVKYEPVPVFLTGNSQEFRLYVLPINVMLKDNADDIREKMEHLEAGHAPHPILERIRREAQGITSTYAGQPTAQPRRVIVRGAGRHGRRGIHCPARPPRRRRRPAAAQLEQFGPALQRLGRGQQPASPSTSSTPTSRLREAGLRVAEHRMAARLEWDADAESFYRSLETQFPYPFIAKPADDGCSSAVKKIKNRAELEAFTRLIFRDQEDLLPADATTLQPGLQGGIPAARRPSWWKRSLTATGPPTSWK